MQNKYRVVETMDDMFRIQERDEDFKDKWNFFQTLVLYHDEASAVEAAELLEKLDLNNVIKRVVS